MHEGREFEVQRKEGEEVIAGNFSLEAKTVRGQKRVAMVWKDCFGEPSRVSAKLR